MKTYRFTQNNSGGYLVGPPSFIVEAASLDDAWNALENEPWFTTDYCDCCGPRWSKSLCSMLRADGEWDFAE